MIILKQMLIFLLMMLVGIIAQKKGYITPSNQKQLSGLIVNIANPAMIISACIGESERIPQDKMLLSLGVAVGSFLLMILVATFLPKLIGFKEEQRGMVRMLFVFSNIGFMGMPMVASIYGSSAVLYVTLFLIPFNILFYTYGILSIIPKEKGNKSGVELRRLFNTGVIACIIALILYFCPIKVPETLTKAIMMLSQMTAPLSMMVIGASFVGVEWKKMMSDYRILLFCVLKMIVVPVILLLVLKQLINEEILMGVCLIMMAAPCGSMAVMVAGEYNEKCLDLATKVVALTTVISVITIPIVSWLTGIGA